MVVREKSPVFKAFDAVFYFKLLSWIRQRELMSCLLKHVFAYFCQFIFLVFLCKDNQTWFVVLLVIQLNIPCILVHYANAEPLNKFATYITPPGNTNFDVCACIQIGNIIKYKQNKIIIGIICMIWIIVNVIKRSTDSILIWISNKRKLMQLNCLFINEN